MHLPVTAQQVGRVRELTQKFRVLAWVLALAAFQLVAPLPNKTEQLHVMVTHMTSISIM